MRKLLSVLVSLVLAVIITGEVTYYSKTLMELVYTNRLAMGHVEPCPECIGYVALLERADVGRKVWLSVDGGATWVGPLLVVDCAAARHLPSLRARGRIAELSYDMWQALGLPRRPVDGQVRFEGPEGKP